MKSNNPVFRRSEEFNRAVASNAYGNQTYAGTAAAYAGYGEPAPATLDLGHRHARPGRPAAG